MRMLLVEDDEAISMGLTYSLEKEGYEVASAKNALEAREAWKPKTYDLRILDVNLPDGTGYVVCQDIKRTEDVPVIFLTAVDAEVNVVMGLELGADDHICKPFRVNEPMSRIRCVLRSSGRTRHQDSASEYIEVAGGIRVYANEAQVTRGDAATGAEEAIELTAVEYRLLLAFAHNRGIVPSRKRLLSGMWDISGDYVTDNTLTVYFKRLRTKTETDPQHPEIIRTIR